MEIVIKIGAALAAYFMATQFIDAGENFMLVGIMFLLVVHFAVSGATDLWAEIESARSEKPGTD